MGTGKSSVAKALAKSTGRLWVEMDATIEKKEGMTITDIFAKKGEPYFRGRERELVLELSAKSGLVISAGGGVVLNLDSVKDFKASGVMVCLTASPETIFARVKHETHRPLLKAENPLAKIKELLETRAPFYALANATVATDGKSVEQIVQEMKEILSS